MQTHRCNKVSMQELTAVREKMITKLRTTKPLTESQVMSKRFLNARELIRNARNFVASDELLNADQLRSILDAYRASLGSPKSGTDVSARFECPGAANP
jgi:hypothetical protein